MGDTEGLGFFSRNAAIQRIKFTYWGSEYPRTLSDADARVLLDDWGAAGKLCAFRGKQPVMVDDWRRGMVDEGASVLEADLDAELKRQWMSPSRDVWNDRILQWMRSEGRSDEAIEIFQFQALWDQKTAEASEHNAAKTLKATAARGQLIDSHTRPKIAAAVPSVAAQGGLADALIHAEDTPEPAAPIAKAPDGQNLPRPKPTADDHPAVAPAAPTVEAPDGRDQRPAAGGTIEVAPSTLIPEPAAPPHATARKRQRRANDADMEGFLAQRTDNWVEKMTDNGLARVYLIDRARRKGKGIDVGPDLPVPDHRLSLLTKSFTRIRARRREEAPKATDQDVK